MEHAGFTKKYPAHHLLTATLPYFMTIKNTSSFLVCTYAMQNQRQHLARFAITRKKKKK